MVITDVPAIRRQVARIISEPLLFLTVTGIVIIVAIFIVYPVLKVASYPGLEDFAAAFANSRWQKAVVNSAFITFVSTLSATLVGFVFAFTLAYVDTGWRRLFKFVAILPIVSPSFILGLAYILLFGRSGIITQKVLGLSLDMYGWQGIWFVQTITYFPYAYVVLKGVLRGVTPSLEYAGHNLGAGHWRTFKDIVWPLALPGTCGAALVVGMMVLADFGNPLLIGGNFVMLPTEAYMQIIGWYNLSAATVLALTLLVPALVFFLAQHYWLSRGSYITTTGKESSLQRMLLPPPVQKALEFFCLAVSAVVLLVYGVLFLGAFCKVWGYDWSLTLANMEYVWGRKTEIINSLHYSFLASLLAAGFSLIMAYTVQRKQTGINRGLDFIAVLPGALPGMFMGIGYLMAFNKGLLKLTGSEWVIILALAFWNLPTGYAAATAGLQQISKSLEEAAANLGSNSFRTFRDIILPLLFLPAASGFVVAFLRSLTCLSVVVFLVTPRTVVGTISILGLVGDGRWSSAAAFTVVLISLAFSVLYAAEYILGKQGKSLDL
ncbi:MAG: iron ABC transporter permease [Negativicutes bacterium]|nr:iron ABC transporter permease [Negativicutes bacterium]